MKVFLDSFLLEQQLKSNMVSTQGLMYCTGVLTLALSLRVLGTSCEDILHFLQFKNEIEVQKSLLILKLQ